MTSPPIRRSAAVLLTRGWGPTLEVFLVERSPKLRFFGGYWAFPGGVVEELDARPEDDGPAAALERCALRELFEETGVLLAPLEMAIDEEERPGLRERLIESGPEASGWGRYAEPLERAREELRLLTTITTPALSIIRHRTPFFHLELPAGQTPQVLPGELTRGEFLPVARILERWRGGQMSVVPPVLFLLELLRDGDLEAFFERAAEAGRLLAAGQLNRVRYTPGILVAPLLTPTLPPAVTTNTMLVGEERVFIVDPGSPEPAEHLRLFETIDRWRDQGRRLEAVLLTHHHHDHVGALGAVCSRYSLPVLAHRETLARVETRGLETRELEHGQTLELGAAPDGRPDWRLHVRHTPGHTPGHLVFVEDRFRAVLAGDLVSTLSTIVIDPPEGHLRTYLESLRAMAGEELGVIHPAHGPGVRDGRAVLEAVLRHRAEREQKLIGVLREGAQTRGELLPVVYDDAPAELHHAAARSLLAGLFKLEEEERVSKETDGRWRLR